MKVVSKLTIEREQELVKASLVDPHRFRPIYDCYYPEIFRFVYSKVEDPNHTADIVSTTFYKAITKLSSFKYTGQSIKKWILRIAYNETMQFFRMESKVRTISIDDSALKTIAEEAQMDEKPSMNDIVKFLDQLDDEELALVELKYLERMKFKEVAEVLQIKVATARVKLHRAIKKIQQQVKEVQDEK